MRRFTDEQRRARLGARHALAPRAESVQKAVAQMTCLHATEPASVYLSLVARSEASRADIDRALYDDRVVVKQLAMRRTLFVFPRDLLPAVWGSASARVAAQLAARLVKEVEGNGVATDGSSWLRTTEAAVLRVLEADGPATTAELRVRLPALASRVELAPGKAYGGSFPLAPRVLSLLGARSLIMRGENSLGWHLARPRWTLTTDWLGVPPRASDPVTGYRVLVERWLRTFGPGTETDLVWWLGATKAAVRRALADLGAIEVELTDGVGYLLPDDLADLDASDPPEPWAALLPVLDPTTMGWKQRGFYLAQSDVPQIFDSNGNAGATAWWNGQVVGCWVQDPDGVVEVVALRDVGQEGRRALRAEADRLTGWLDGHRVGTVYPSALMKAARPTP